MTTAIIYSRSSTSLEAPLITIETHLSSGLPGFNLVGLAATAVRESKDRVRSAIINSRFEFPMKRITVNLAPADLPKEGGRYDLAIALGILVASGQVNAEDIDQYEFLGELALTGVLRPIRASLSSTRACENNGRTLILPSENTPEACLASADHHLGAGQLLDVCAHLNKISLLSPHKHSDIQQNLAQYTDMRVIKGQEQARRALEIAACGQHKLLFEGPPGCGKTLLAKSLPGILPALSKEQALEVLTIRSLVDDQPDLSAWSRRPFRAPHHSASSAALVGGGNPPRPGEISMAHRGVLFLDELPEFQRNVLEALREPLENGEICISRASRQARFPANFQLIAAMNPCPCGYYRSQKRQCQCSIEQIRRYRNKLSGPLLDRIDMHLQLQPTPVTLLTQTTETEVEDSQTIRQRVTRCQQLQFSRQQKTNAELNDEELKVHVVLSSSSRQTLEAMAEKLQLSGRALQRSIRLARTIADMEKADDIAETHILEALSYRQSEINNP